MDNSTHFWTASEHEAPPKDRPFWAYLHQTGVHRMVWCADLYEHEGGYVLFRAARDDDYEPEFWAPLGAIPDPADQFADLQQDRDGSVSDRVTDAVEPSTGRLDTNNADAGAAK